MQINSRKILGKFLAIVASVASIISLVILIFNDSYKALIALIFLISVILILFVLVCIILKNYLKQAFPSGYAKISTINRYETKDAKKITYEVYKHIQCKKAFLTEYDHGFDWTGSKLPKISSNLEIGTPDISKNINDYDKIHLQFEKPLLYNEIGIVHLRMDLDDSNQKSSPHIEIRVSEPTSMIQFQVILKYKPNKYNKDAVLMRKKIDQKKPEDYKDIDIVSFDRSTKSYDHTLLDPDVGYYYKLLWER